MTQIPSSALLDEQIVTDDLDLLLDALPPRVVDSVLSIFRKASSEDVRTLAIDALLGIETDRSRRALAEISKDETVAALVRMRSDTPGGAPVHAVTDGGTGSIAVPTATHK